MARYFLTLPPTGSAHGGSPARAFFKLVPNLNGGQPIISPARDEVISRAANECADFILRVHNGNTFSGSVHKATLCIFGIDTESALFAIREALKGGWVFVHTIEGSHLLTIDHIEKTLRHNFSGRIPEDLVYVVENVHRLSPEVLEYLSQKNYAIFEFGNTKIDTTAANCSVLERISRTASAVLDISVRTMILTILGDSEVFSLPND
jgi:hypothetical protein